MEDVKKSGKILRAIYSEEEIVRLRERLIKDFKEKGLSIVAYSKMVGIPIVSIRTILTQDGLPRPENMLRLEKYLLSLDVPK